jgi:hypothetical protein
MVCSDSGWLTVDSQAIDAKELEMLSPDMTPSGPGQLPPLQHVPLLRHDQHGVELVCPDLVQADVPPKLQRRPKIEIAADQLPAL